MAAAYGWPEVLVSDVWPLVWRALVVALAVVGLDLLCTHFPVRAVDPLMPEQRVAGLRNLLTLFGLPSALLVALTGFAIPTLSPYANPSLVLLYRRHATTKRETVLTWALGNGNPFSWALQLSLYISLSLFFVLALGTLQWTGQFTPVLFLAAAAALGELLLLLVFVYWVIGLRHPSRVIGHTLGMANNALTWLKDLPATHAYKPLPAGFSRGPYKTKFREQEKLLRIAEALTQATLRALHDRQPMPAREGIEALADLFTSAGTARPKDDAWYQMLFVRDVAEPRFDWFRLFVLDGLHDVLVASAEAHYMSVGLAALRALEQIGANLLAKEKPGDQTSRQLFRRVLNSYVDAFDETLQFQEHNLRAELLPSLITFVFQIGDANTEGDKGASGWTQLLLAELPNMIKELGTPGVTYEDFGALRALTALLMKVKTEVPESEPVIAGGVIYLGASAVALRSDRAVSLLAGWIAGQFDRSGALTSAEGQVLVRRARQEPPRPLPPRSGDARATPASPVATDRRPDVDYVQVFLVLVAARGMQFGSDWLRESTVKIRFAARDLKRGQYRCKWVCERMGNQSHLGSEEIKGWVKEVTNLWSTEYAKQAN